MGFHLGFVLNNKTRIEYRFGYAFNKKGRNERLNYISLSNMRSFEALLENNNNSNECEFKAIFGSIECNFKVKANNNMNNSDKQTVNVVLNGIEGEFR